MTATPDIDREQQIADEALEAWKETAFRYLDARYGAELPWTDAKPEGRAEEDGGEDERQPAA